MTGLGRKRSQVERPLLADCRLSRVAAVDPNGALTIKQTDRQRLAFGCPASEVSGS